MGGIGEALKLHRFIRSESQASMARRYQFDRSTLAKIEAGTRPCPPELEKHLVRESWRFALRVADERTGGWIGNLLDKMPGMDLHPSALKEVLLRELRGLITVMEATQLAKGKQSEAKIEALWMKLKDVCDKAPIVMGVLEETFELDRDRLIAQYEGQVRRGER